MLNDIISAGAYGGALRTLAHRLKEGDTLAPAQAAALLAPLLDRTRTLVPVPSHGGRATYTADICRILELDYAFFFSDCLRCAPYRRRYDAKSRGEAATTPQFSLVVPAPARVTLIDNVIATGITAATAAALFDDATAAAVTLDRTMLAI